MIICHKKDRKHTKEFKVGTQKMFVTALFRMSKEGNNPRVLQ
jgi:hypothetical protein